jgi:hypothetical protein
MIILTYKKVILFRNKPNRNGELPQRWSTVSGAHIDDTISVITYFILDGDTRNLYDSVVLDGMSNPLTQLRNRGIKIAQ